MKKEEPKIYTQDDYFNDEFPKEKPKQETLEEAKERYLDSPTPHSYRLAVEFGAKWQQEQDKDKLELAEHLYTVVYKEKERSYSEEEVLPLLEIIQKCKEYFLLKTDKYSDERADAIIDVMENFNEWITNEIDKHLKEQ